MQLMLDNLPPEVTAEDLHALFTELGIPAPRELTIAPGLRGHPSAAAAFELNHAQMEAIVGLLDGRQWHGHMMHARHSALFS
jgi:hypothetical protein